MHNVGLHLIGTTATNSYTELKLTDGNAGYAFQVRSDAAQSIATGSFVLNDVDSSTFPIVINEGSATNTLKIDSEGVKVTTISQGPLGGRRNAVMNPCFQINQRHGTGANTTINTYAMDRWRSYGGGSSPAHAMSWTTRSDAGEGNGYYGRFQRTADNTATHTMGISQGWETDDSKYYAGKEVTLSFRARAGANWSPTNGTVGFGLAGGEGTNENPVSMTNTDIVFRIDANLPQGGGFVQYSGTGTIPADKTQLALQVSWTPVGTAGANDYWDVREVQLELGDTVTQFENRSTGEEFQLCQRYFEKSDDPQFHINSGAAGSQVQRHSIRYATQKWEDATLVVSSSTSGLSGAVTNGVDGFTLGFSGSDLDVHHITFTAESEL